MELMKGLIHTNIVRYYGYEMDREQKNLFNIFMEYMPQGTLSGVSKKFHPLPYENVRYARSYSCKSGLNFAPPTFVNFVFHDEFIITTLLMPLNCQDCIETDALHSLCLVLIIYLVSLFSVIATTPSKFLKA